MRLLHLHGVSSFSLVEYLDNTIPAYAILSHTWGPTNEEVTYQDLLNGTGKEKVGFRKLHFCANQAAKDDLCYFWIDTCCIDKASSAELAEAINSMFRWYRDAAKCYVYLSDVSSRECTGDSVSFLESRWFTRGWTLQELLAPNCVEFYSQEGDLIGDKISRVQEVAESTCIDPEALLGRALSRFSVEERMKWASRRRTTREEDKAYSLLGVFDIFMPLIYGEGQENAFKRLRKNIKRKSEDDLQQRNLVFPRKVIQRPDPSKARTFIHIQTNYCRHIILTIRFEEGCNCFSINSSSNQDQCTAQCSGITFTVAYNELVSSPAERRGSKREYSSQLQLFLEPNEGADEIVCDTSIPFRSC
jgi:hypothetical protein